MQLLELLLLGLTVMRNKWFRWQITLNIVCIIGHSLVIKYTVFCQTAKSDN